MSDVYVQIRDDNVGYSECLTGDMNVDKTDSGTIVGVELLSAVRVEVDGNVVWPVRDEFRTAIVHALGMDVSDSNEEIVRQAERAWRTTQGLVEGVLVDEGVTELPGVWVPDNGPPEENPTGDWAAGDLVQYDDHGCKFTARLIEPTGGFCWSAIVKTFEGYHDHEGVIAVGAGVSVVYGHSVKLPEVPVIESAEAVSSDG